MILPKASFAYTLLIWFDFKTWERNELNNVNKNPDNTQNGDNKSNEPRNISAGLMILPIGKTMFFR